MLFLVSVLLPCLALALPGAYVTRCNVRLALASDLKLRNTKGLLPLDFLLTANNTLLACMALLPFTLWIDLTAALPSPLGWASYSFMLVVGLFVGFLAWRCRRPPTVRPYAFQNVLRAQSYTLLSYCVGGFAIVAFPALFAAPSRAFVLLLPGALVGFAIGLVAVTLGTAAGQIGTVR